MEENRIRRSGLVKKITSADEAAGLIQDGMVVATSGFTPAGYPKAVPLALAQRAESGEQVKITLMTGASVGEELDGALTRAGVIAKRFPYQTNSDIRISIKSGKVAYQDFHLSQFPQSVDYGFFGKVDVALVEALAITPGSGIVPTISVGITPTAIKTASKIIVEVNHNQPLSLEGIHNIYLPEQPPHRQPIPITTPGD